MVTEWTGKHGVQGLDVLRLRWRLPLRLPSSHLSIIVLSLKTEMFRKIPSEIFATLQVAVFVPSSTEILRQRIIIIELKQL